MVQGSVLMEMCVNEEKETSLGISTCLEIWKYSVENLFMSITSNI